MRPVSFNQIHATCIHCFFYLRPPLFHSNIFENLAVIFESLQKVFSVSLTRKQWMRIHKRHLNNMYMLFCITSGAVQIGVHLLPEIVCKVILSVSKKRQFLKKKQWMIQFEWRYDIPAAIPYILINFFSVVTNLNIMIHSFNLNDVFKWLVRWKLGDNDRLLFFLEVNWTASYKCQ